MLLLLIVSFDSLLFISSTTTSIDDCVLQCESNRAAEDNDDVDICLKRCQQHNSDEQRNIADLHTFFNHNLGIFPQPPSNVTVSLTTTIADDGVEKVIQAMLFWQADDDDDNRRIGFYIRMIAIDSTCEHRFPGYYALNIGPHSKPYPYGDHNYRTLLHYTVPNCVDSYCSCSDVIVPSPQNISAIVIDRHIHVRWKYSPISDQQEYTFYVQLARRLRHNSLMFQDSSAFRYVLTNVNQALKSKPGQTEFDLVLSYTLDDVDDDYKIILFAVNQHICHSTHVTLLFNSANAQKSNVTSTTIISSTSLSSSTTTTTTMMIEIVTSDTESTQVSIDADQHHSQLPNWYNFVLIIVGAGIISIGCICIYRRHLRYRHNIKQQQIGGWSSSSPHQTVRFQPTMQPNILYTNRAILAESEQFDIDDDYYEIALDRLQFGRVIGQGAFGLVFLGTMRTDIATTASEQFHRSTPMTVAIKQLKPNADESEREQFLAEMNIMKLVGRQSQNVVAMYGYCTVQSPQCMVMEYCPHGDLKQYLHSLRKQLERAWEHMKASMRQDYVINIGDQHRMPSSLPVSLHSSFMSTAVADETTSSDFSYSLDPAELQSFAVQVANGMAHIESLDITHRDLAARNVLVGYGKVLKISDFGLSRHGVYVKTTRGVIPLRWLSVEAIRDNIYSTKSDVWAFGVVLWEICTLGGFPYPTISDKDLLRYLETGGRLEKPTSCTDEIYRIMIDCWAYSEEERPTFAELCARITELSNQSCPYVEFEPDSNLPPPDGYCTLLTD